MSDVVSKKCDNCDVVKAEVNGWWFVAGYLECENGGMLHVGPHSLLEHWKRGSVNGAAENWKVLDLCGQGCLVEMIGKIVGKVRREG